MKKVLKKILKFLLIFAGIILILFALLFNYVIKEEDGNYFFFAVRNNDPALCKTLLFFGADVNERDKEGNTPIQYAVEEGDIALCKLLIKHGANVNVKDIYGDTLLHKAIKIERKGPFFRKVLSPPIKKAAIICKILLEAGADVNVKNNRGETPLHLAAAKWDFESCKLLIKYGAKINPLTNEGFTPLDCAKLGDRAKRAFFEMFQLPPLEKAERLIKAQDIQVIKLLEKNGGKDSPFWLLIAGIENNNINLIKKTIKQGADVNRGAWHIPIPIYIAAKKGNLNLCKLLIKNGTKLTDIRKFNIISYAIKHNHINIVKYFIENLKVDINIKDEEGNTLLHKAAYFRQPEFTEYLLSKGADVNAKNNNGNTPLHELFNEYCDSYEKEATINVLKTCEILFKHGAEINARNKKNLTPLFLAVQHDPFVVIKYLIQNGAIYNEAVKKSGFPVSFAAYWGHKGIQKYFIEELKFDPGREDLEGWTLLHWACAKTYLDAHPLIKSLNPFQPDKSGLTPVDLAIIDKIDSSLTDLVWQNNNPQIIIFIANIYFKKYKAPKEEKKGKKYICKKLKIPENKFHYSPAGKLIIGAITDNTSLIEEALKQNANINLTEKFIGTPLTLAVYWRSYKACKTLLKHGADVNIQDYNGNTPLMHAIGNEDLKMCKLLIEHGADVNIKNNWKDTPLHNATGRGNFKIYNFLLKHGANVNAKDKEGKTPLHWASFFGHLKECKLLIQHGAKVNEKNNNGETPLFAATREGNFETCKLLIKHGANVNVTNKFGENPLNIAKEKGYMNIVNLLKQHGAKE